MNALLQKWYEQSLALVPEMYRAEIREYLDPTVKHCRAKTRARYWQWLRQQIAKMSQEEAEFFFEYLKESYLPVDRGTPFEYEVSADGELLLIDVPHKINRTKQTTVHVWKLPLKDLDWAKSIFPFHIRTIPPLDSPEILAARALKAKLRGRRLGFKERYDFESALTQVKAKIAEGDVTAMPVRYGVYKNVGGKEVSVARMYLRADIGEDVDALDGDLLNYGTVYTERITRPIFYDGAAVVPGISNPANPVRVERGDRIPNLYIIQGSANPRHLRTMPSEEPDLTVPQQKFEKSILQASYGLDGDPLLPVAADHDGEVIRVDNSDGVPTPGNADLGARTGVRGSVQDAGRFKPLSVNEAKELGLQGLETPIIEELESETTKELGA